MAFGSLPSVLGSGGGTAYSLIGGTGLFADGTAAAPSISFASDTDTGIYRFGANVLGFSTGGVALWSLYSSGGSNFLQSTGTNGLYAKPAGEVGLFAGGSAQNITLTPSTTGQVSHIGLSNFSDTLFFGNSSGSYGRITWGSALTFQAGAGLPFTLVSNNGTEVARGFANGRFGIGTGATDSGALLQIGTNLTTGANGMVFGTDTFLYRGAGGSLHLNASSNPLIGLAVGESRKGYLFYNSVSNYVEVAAETASSSLRLVSAGTVALTLDASQNAAFASAVSVAASSSYSWATRSIINSPADGVLLLRNNAGTDFYRLQFGGTTASFPAIARNGAVIEFKLADNSDYAETSGKFYRAVGAAGTAGAGAICYGGTTATTVGAAGGASALPATPTGYIIVNVAGTNMKVPYYAN